jgi:hypothetical protein
MSIAGRSLNLPEKISLLHANFRAFGFTFKIAKAFTGEKPLPLTLIYL